MKDKYSLIMSVSLYIMAAIGVTSLFFSAINYDLKSRLIESEILIEQLEKRELSALTDGQQMRVYLLKIIAQNDVTFPECYDYDRFKNRNFSEFCVMTNQKETLLHHAIRDMTGGVLRGVKWEPLVYLRRE